MTRTLLLSTVVLGTWTAAALAEPTIQTPVPVQPAVKAEKAVPGQTARIELTDSQLDATKAGLGPPNAVVIRICLIQGNPHPPFCQ
jgi:hypothetical protein